MPVIGTDLTAVWSTITIGIVSTTAIFITAVSLPMEPKFNTSDGSFG
jgi:hypothetical protein